MYVCNYVCQGRSQTVKRAVAAHPIVTAYLNGERGSVSL